MLRGGRVKELYEMAGQGMSVRGIARALGVSRNTVRKYLRAEEVPQLKVRSPRESKIEPYKDYVRSRLAEGVDNCVVLLREIRELGYTGGVTILRDFVRPYRLPKEPRATVRFETKPGQQAQVDFGRYRYRTVEGKHRQVWAFVMVLGWSRALYVEFLERAETVSFIWAHIRAFEHFGGVPEHCLYDNTKQVVLKRGEGGEPVWNERFLDFSLRAGFDLKLCRPYRAQTKGKAERGVAYVEGNFWPGAEFVDLADLNQKAREWLAAVADARVHGTTRERPADRLVEERQHLGPVPLRARLASLLREEHKVERDGSVHYEGSWYGVSWGWAGCKVQVQADEDTVCIFSGEELLAVHPRARRRGTRQVLPGQWDGLPRGDKRRKPSPVAVQVGTVEVEQRPLATYSALVDGGVR